MTTDTPHTNGASRLLRSRLCLLAWAVVVVSALACWNLPTTVYGQVEQERSNESSRVPSESNEETATTSQSDGTSNTGTPQPTLDSAASSSEDVDALLRRLLPLVTDDAIAGCVVYPQQFFASDVLQSLPAEVVAFKLREHYRVDFSHMQFGIGFLVPDEEHSLAFGVILRFDSPFEWRSINETLLQRTAFDELHGKPYRRGKGPLDFSIYLVDEQTLVVAPDKLLRRMMALRQEEAPASSIAASLATGVAKKLDLHLVANVAALRPYIESQLGAAVAHSEHAQLFSQMMQSADRFEIRGRISQQLALGAIVTTAEARDAGKFNEDLTAWRESLSKVDAQDNSSPVVIPATDASVCAIDSYVARALERTLAKCFTRVSGNRLQIGLRGNTATHISANASVAMVLDRIIDEAYLAIQREQTSIALQRLSTAMNEYARVNHRFPASANVSSEGLPLLSWRVHVLPFMGHQKLYKEFHLDEPWDSAHNRALIPRMPAIYQNPRERSDYMTSFLVPVGNGTMFESLREGVRRTEIRDDHSSTILLVDADQAVVWTRPQDLRLDKDDLWRGLGDSPRRGFLGAAVDASVNFYQRSLNEDELEVLFTRNDEAALRAF